MTLQAPLSSPDSPHPSGFRPLPIRGGFVVANGPIFGRKDADGAPVLGLRIEARHTNTAGICHGGMLMMLADMVLGFGAAFATGGRKFLPTVNMSADFLAPAPLGAWLEGKGRVLRVTRNLAFAECVLAADGVPALRASGIMKVPAAEGGLDIADLFA